jgi:hypothetical protein
MIPSNADVVSRQGMQAIPVWCRLLYEAAGLLSKPRAIISLHIIMSASVGLLHQAVNLYLMSYIRHITNNFLLDGKGCFVVKLHT